MLRTQSTGLFFHQKAHEGAIERSIDWLMTRHRKAVHSAIDEMLFGGLDEKDQAKLEDVSPESWQSIQLNATEWLIAEGQILVKNEHYWVSELLFGRGGPLFTVDQRRWIEQMAERPLRLYDVTDVHAGAQMTLCDSLDTNAPPVVVLERSGSVSSLIGTRLAVRLMEVDGHYELSGGVYPFSRLLGATIVGAMEDAEDQFRDHPENLPGYLSYIIRRQWIEQFIRPAPMPTMMDGRSGDPILLITDHYQVKNWDALTKALATEQDVDGDRTAGWSRLQDCTDGFMRPISTINIGNGKNKVELFHKTQTDADRGRVWFDQVAGSSVAFTGRVVSDLKGLMKNMPAG